MDDDQKILHPVTPKFLAGNPKEKGPSFLLTGSLDLKGREMISLVGAGGKTTLMFHLAKERWLDGKRVVTTTTTKILEPTAEETGFLFIESDEEKIRQWVDPHLNEYHHITIARERLEGRKLKGISSDLVDDLWNLGKTDYIIVEADGAAGRPIKAPRESEPVIPSNTTLVVGILGVDGVGKKLDEENVFQTERVSKITGVPIGKPLTIEAMAILLTHPEGIFKGSPSSSRRVVCLNKVEIAHGVAKAQEIAHSVFKKEHHRVERVVLGQLKMEPPVVEVIFP